MTPTPPTDTTAALSAERTLEEMQALRQSVRDKLYGALPGNLAALADYLRVPSLLDEGDELQRRLEAVSPWDAGREAQRSQLQLDYFTIKQRAEVAEAALVLEKRRAGEWCSMADTTPSTTRPYIVAAPAPHRSGLITLRRTFLYIGDGVWGVHGKMECTRTDITHFRQLPPPPDELE